jgi:dipeptidyl aminopeptidase/acylaminoacyl peptidase
MRERNRGRATGTARWRLVLVLAVLPLTSGAQDRAAQNRTKDAYILPPSPIREYIDRDKSYATLDQASPDGDHFLIPSTTELSSLELMSQKIYRLAMLKVTPETNRELDHSTYGVYRLRIYSLKDRAIREVKLPSKAIVSDMTWSPDGKRLAFAAHLAKGSQIWVADAATGEARPFHEAWVMATLAKRPEFGRNASGPSPLIQWTPDGSILTLLVPADRGPEPAANPIPSSPVVRRSLDKPSPTATLPFLLRTSRDQDLFRYYTTSQIAVLSPGQAPQRIGPAGMYSKIALSKDGKYLLADRIVEPLSYLVGHASFAHELQVFTSTGSRLATVASYPLNEGLSNDGDAGGAGGDAANADGPRDVAWRPDGKGLGMLKLEERKRGEAEDADGRKDRVLLLEPPFDPASAKTLLSSPRRIADVVYSADGKWLFATLSERPRTGGKRRQDIVAYDLTAAEPRPYTLVKDSDPSEILKLPGTVLARADGNGIESAFLSSSGDACYLQGQGYKADFKPRPFIDRVTIRTAAKERVFEGSADLFEKPLRPLDADLTRIVVSRESMTSFPDSFLWSKAGGAEKLTQNRDPYPDLTACKRVDFSFTRADGLTVHARISLPTNYREGTRVPAIFWDYPREYTSNGEYSNDAIRSRNANAFTHLSFLRWSDLWLTQGYALVYTDIPIVGKGNTFNDFYLTHLTDSVYGAIRKLDALGYIDVDRLGHGGHSYGAFATGNLLSHTPFFKAGIAGDGAYISTLTPMTFQRERRFFWDATTTYLEMSPFFYADQINAPMLMYHGGEDDNSGTFLIQSERMMQALTGLGKKAALYVYPFEAHSPRCKETYLDIWARWIDWFDTYVKGTPGKAEPQVRTAP